MTLFIYSAANNEGKVVKGEREAENEKALAAALKAEKLFLIEAKDKKMGAGGRGLHMDIGALFSRLMPISLVEKMFFSRNLAVMVSAGLSLTKALDALTEQAANARFKAVIGEVNDAIVKGKSFSEALRPHEKVFGELYVNMIEVGETTGKLALVLKLLANQMKKDHDLKKRVRGAMMYPVVIFVALGGIGALMMIYVVPTLTKTINELKVELPISTQIIIFVSDLITAYGLLVLGAVVAFAILVWRLLKTDRFKTLFDRMIIRVPVFGPLIRKFNVARFCRTLAYLIACRVPNVPSLEVTAGVLGHSLFRSAVKEAEVEIQKGKQLHEILARHSMLFEPMIIQMIGVGQETGKLSEMLLRLALFFEEDVTNTTKNLSTIIEPMLMVVIGGIVGFFAISMLQPIYGSLGNI